MSSSLVAIRVPKGQVGCESCYGFVIRLSKRFLGFHKILGCHIYIYTGHQVVPNFLGCCLVGKRFLLGFHLVYIASFHNKALKDHGFQPKIVLKSFDSPSMTPLSFKGSYVIGV